MTTDIKVKHLKESLRFTSSLFGRYHWTPIRLTVISIESNLKDVSNFKLPMCTQLLQNGVFVHQYNCKKEQGSYQEGWREKHRNWTMRWASNCDPFFFFADRSPRFRPNVSTPSSDMIRCPRDLYTSAP